MKPMKSIVLLTVGALAFSSCSKKADDNQTTATGYQDTTMGAGTAGTDMNATGADAATLNAAGTDANTTNATQTTEQGSGLGAAGAGAAVGAGAASETHSHDSHSNSDFSTNEGSGAISDDELNSDQLGEDDEFIEDTSAVDEEALPTNRGTGASTSDTESEFIDETSSEPDDVRGGRDSRMVPKYEGVDNTSSEPDPNQM